MELLQAFAALAKLTYCADAPGTQSAVEQTCAASQGVCRRAGFGVVTSTVVPVAIGTSGFSADWFFFTAMLSRIPGYEAPLHLVPERACVVAFRGTVSHANIVANNHQRQMPLNDTECGQCVCV